MIGTLLTHSGAVRVTREQLKAVETPVGTQTWKPVSHAELVDVLEQELARRALEVRAEAYAIQREGALLFGVLDLAWRRTEEFAAAVGLRTANDKTLSIQIAVGFRVFVCDNLVFSGDLIALRRKHTSGLDLPREISQAMDRYEDGVLDLEREIGRLKDTAISDREAKEFIFDAFQQVILPVRFFRPVSDTYFRPLPEGYGLPPRTLWTLHNVFTYHIRKLSPAAAFEATARLGRLFGLGQSRSDPRH